MDTTCRSAEIGAGETAPACSCLEMVFAHHLLCCCCCCCLTAAAPNQTQNLRGLVPASQPIDPTTTILPGGLRTDHAWRKEVGGERQGGVDTPQHTSNRLTLHPTHPLTCCLLFAVLCTLNPRTHTLTCRWSRPTSTVNTGGTSRHGCASQTRLHRCGWCHQINQIDALLGCLV